jgi:hypothetical protein
MSEKCHQRKSGALFDHFVGAEQQRRRYLNLNAFAVFTFDDQVKFGL